MYAYFSVADIGDVNSENNYSYLKKIRLLLFHYSCTYPSHCHKVDITNSFHIVYGGGSRDDAYKLRFLKGSPSSPTKNAWFGKIVILQCSRILKINHVSNLNVHAFLPALDFFSIPIFFIFYFF